MTQKFAAAVLITITVIVVSLVVCLCKCKKEKLKDALNSVGSFSLGLGTLFLGSSAIIAISNPQPILMELLELAKDTNQKVSEKKRKEGAKLAMENNPALSSKDSSVEMIRNALKSEFQLSPGLETSKVFLPENKLNSTATGMFDSKDPKSREAILYDALQYGKKEQTTDD